MTQIEQLQSLMDAQAETGWPFNEQNYPGWDSMSMREELMFAVNHVLKHQAKALGAAFAAVEPYDHGGSVNHADLRKRAAKMFANALRLASLLKIPPEELVRLTLSSPPD